MALFYLILIKKKRPSNALNTNFECRLRKCNFSVINNYYWIEVFEVTHKYVAVCPVFRFFGLRIAKGTH
jgi:hypothetical protein